MSFRYGQFCPIAKASEVLGERWTILIIRELLMGSTRYSDFQRALSQISPTLLTKRLNQLVDCGLVIRDSVDGTNRAEYRLSDAGQELGPIVMGLGEWGMKWARGEMKRDELDVQLLMHDYCRRLDANKLPRRRTVIGFHFPRLRNYANWWIKIEPGRERELCFCHPGGDINVMIRANVRTLVEIWMGDTEIRTALREGRMEVTGEPALVRSLPSWLRTSKMAHIRPDSTPLRV